MTTPAVHPESLAATPEVPLGVKAELGKLTRAQKEKLLQRLREAEAEALEKEERAKAADPFWFYDPSTGHIPPEARAFLERHLKPEDIPPVLPGQLDIHKSEAPIRGASGGNQSGKTLSCCIEAFIKTTGEVPPSLENVYPKTLRLPKDQFSNPQKVRVVAKDWENGALLNVIPTYKQWVPREFLPEGRWDKGYKAEEATLILSRNGRPTGYIEFMSNAQMAGSFQGPPRDKVIYDEEPFMTVYKENLMRFTTRGSLDVMFGMTPTEGITWVYDLVNSGQDAGGNRVDWYKLVSVTNKKANLAILDQIVQDLTYEEKLMRLLGEFVSISGLVYGRIFSRKLHVIPPFSAACNCGLTTGEHLRTCPWYRFTVYRGFDPHLVTPTACVWLAVDRLGIHYVLDSWFEEADTEIVKAGVAKRSVGMRTAFSVADSAADSDIEAFGGFNIFQRLAKGANKIKNLRLASKGPGSIRSGVDEIKKLLRIHPILGRPMLYFCDTPGNRLLIKAMETMQRHAGAQEDKKGPQDKILESKHHLHAALRYLFTQKIRWRDPYEAPPVDEPHYLEEEIYA